MKLINQPDFKQERKKTNGASNEVSLETFIVQLNTP